MHLDKDRKSRGIGRGWTRGYIILALSGITVLGTAVYGLAAGTNPASVLVRSPARTAAQAPSPVTGQIAKSEMERLQGLGYQATDIMTAWQLAQRSGAQVDALLAKHKAGADWKAIALAQAPSHPADANPPQPASPADPGPTGLSPQQVQTYAKQGYDVKDVMQASALAREFSTTTDAVLSTYKASGSWDATVKQLSQAGGSCVNGDCKVLLGDDGKGTRTVGGLSRSDIVALQDQGYTLDDIMLADAIAAANGLKPQDVLALKGTGGDWNTALGRLRAAHNGLAGSTHTPAGDPGKPPTSVPGTDLSADDISRYLAAGYTHADIDSAWHLAQLYGTTVQAILDQYAAANKSWAQTGANLSLAAKQSGKSPAAPAAQPGGTLKTDDVAQQTGLSRSDVDTYVAQGHSLPDIRQAAIIARVSGAAMAQVLAAKTPDRDWLDVARSFKADPQKGGN
ncbi:MAG TPA: hypothetical protein VGK74_27475 [Symbiobacteriaceae bacterium]|jgi:hypothetical protein